MFYFDFERVHFTHVFQSYFTIATNIQLSHCQWCNHDKMIHRTHESTTKTMHILERCVVLCLVTPAYQNMGAGCIRWLLTSTFAAWTEAIGVVSGSLSWHCQCKRSFFQSQYDQVCFKRSKNLETENASCITNSGSFTKVCDENYNYFPMNHWYYAFSFLHHMK